MQVPALATILKSAIEFLVLIGSTVVSIQVCVGFRALSIIIRICTKFIDEKSNHYNRLQLLY